MKTAVLRFVFAVLVFSVAGARAATDTAVFAGGCFWCVESDFDKVPGVLATVSGYIGGKVANPTYEQVSRNQTGHAEAVEVLYDPRKVTYAQLVEYFWRTIDPTVKDRQFCDTGSPYRSAIFTVGDEQMRIARASSVQGADRHPDRRRRPVLPGRGLPPGLLPQEPDPLRVLPQLLRARCAPEAAVGRHGGQVPGGLSQVWARSLARSCAIIHRPAPISSAIPTQARAFGMSPQTR